MSGTPREQAYRELLAPMGGALLNIRVDDERREVSTRIAGFAQSRAVYLDGAGCVLTPEGVTLAAVNASAAAPKPSPEEDRVVEPASAALRAALDRAFAETGSTPHRFTKAVVILREDRIVAERYAPGVGVHTPLAGWSATKSVVNALLGVLVRQGWLRMDAPEPVPEWSPSGDPRRAITTDQLLRMQSGLDLGESLRTSFIVMFDPSVQMIFLHQDSARIAAAAPLGAPPGARWNYTNANTQLLSRILLQQAGGTPEAFLAFARRELFDKIGMRDTVFEFNVAGTPIGASHLLASARDWARFGQLYLHDGVAGGECILPEGWVDYSAAATPGSEVYGYGAGFWTERGEGEGQRYRRARGLLADSFMARGALGQYVIVVPSERLMAARLGIARTERDDADTVIKMVREAIEATRPR
ncbi:MAG: beta-lactamase family protein [Candidatus Protistobacter heckmanni]|nr:beta-lactamase family protein [Candidatus Protistobacter heckmanni]